MIDIVKLPTYLRFFLINKEMQNSQCSEFCPCQMGAQLFTKVRLEENGVNKY